MGNTLGFEKRDMDAESFELNDEQRTAEPGLLRVTLAGK